MTKLEELEYYKLALKDYKAVRKMSPTEKENARIDNGFCWYFFSKHGVMFSELKTLYFMYSTETKYIFWFSPSLTSGRITRLRRAIVQLKEEIKNDTN